MTTSTTTTTTIIKIDGIANKETKKEKDTTQYG